MATTSFQVTPGTGQAVRVVTNPGSDSGAAQSVVSLADQTGILMPSDPDGTLQTSNDPSALFFDAFDNTLSAWTTGGTAPSISGGSATFASTTSASTVSYMRTNGTFLLRPQAYLRQGNFVQIGETTSAITNNTRWWGYGQNQSSPSATAPVLNGAVFMIDYSAGAMYAAIYSAGTRTQSVAITRPTDGGWHKYEVWFKQAIVYFLIDGVTVASITYPNTAVTSGMYLIAGSANAATAPGTAPVLKLSSASMADTSGTNHNVSDGLQPWLMATVKAAGAPAPASTDNPLYVEALQVPSTTVTSTAAAGTAVTVTLAAPGTGLRHYITAIAVEQYASAATTGSATAIVTTASNHTWVTTMPTAAAIGAVFEKVRIFNSPMGSTTSNTATSFTAPATSSIIWRVTVSYFIAP